MIEVFLKKDLSKNILRGHPWIYDEAVEHTKEQKNASLCKLKDKKGKTLAYGLLDPVSQLRLRILSIAPQIFDKKQMYQRLNEAKELRNTLMNTQKTNAYRLINGEGDLLPGLVCDLYSHTAILQMDGEGPEHFWLEIMGVADWFKENFSSVAIKKRGKKKGSLEWLKGEEEALVKIKEHGLEFLVDLDLGQKTGLFLDQRENRKYIGEIAKGKEVLNLFAYTGGFSLYAAIGGAKKAVSVDISKGACDFANKNMELNHIPSDQHEERVENVFDILEEEKKWDMIIVDPPSMAQNQKQREAAKKKYIDLFQKVTRKVKPGGDLVFSSCSSHISFHDFEEIINESLSKARSKGQILRLSGQGPDHPYPHYLPEMRYLKFVHIRKNS